MSTKPSLNGFQQLPMLSVQMYERYLPMAFDDSLTILERINKVIEYMNQVGKLSNEVVAKWNEVMEWILNESLYEEVSKKLDEFLADGTLDTIINETLFNGLEQRITSLEELVDQIHGDLSDRLSALDTRVTNEVTSLSQTISNNKADIENKFGLRRVWRSVKEYGAKGDGVNDDTVAIQSALNNGKNVFLPDGLYKVTAELNIKAHTHLKLAPNAVIRRYHDGIVLQNYDSTSSGYNGQGNLIIEGGVFDVNGDAYPDVANGIALAHADGVILRDLTVLDTPKGHAIEITGSKNVLIDNIKVKGYRIDDAGNNYYVEAIQIEPTLPPPAGAGYTYPYVTDSTTTRDVTIRNSYFGPSANYPAFPCAIGAHGAKYNLFYENIKIIGNTIEGASYWGLRPFKFQHSIIANNTIKNGDGGGVYIVTPSAGESIKDISGVVKTPQSIDNFVVNGNIIDNIKGTGIRVEGDASYLNHFVTITSNVLRGIGSRGIELENVSFSTIESNVINTCTGRALSIIKSLRCLVRGNLIKKCLENAVFVATSNFITFSENLIDEVTFYGFNISGDNTHIRLIGNDIIDCSQAGQGLYDYILVTNGVNGFHLINNKIRRQITTQPRYGVNIQSGVIAVVRFGNDLRVGGVSGNLSDGSTNPVTTSDDIV